MIQYLGGGPRKVDDLPTSPINQFRDYFIQNRIEKLVSVNYRFPTGNKKTSKTIDQTVFKLDFWPKSGFPKTRVSSPVAPPGGVIFPEMTPPKIFSGNARKHHKSLFFNKMAATMLQNGWAVIEQPLPRLLLVNLGKSSFSQKLILL